MYDSIYKPTKKKIIVDFNQGIDSRLVIEQNMRKFAEVNIYPLRIAFDHWEQMSMKKLYVGQLRAGLKIYQIIYYIIFRMNLRIFIL